MRHWAKLCVGALLLIGLHLSARAVYVEGNPLVNADPTGMNPIYAEHPELKPAALSGPAGDS